MTKIRRRLAMCVMAVLVLLGVGLTNVQNASAYEYLDWGWINTVDGGIHIYGDNYCGDYGYPYDRCWRIKVDYDVWGHGTFWNVVEFWMPSWMWIQAIQPGTPGVSPAWFILGVHPTHALQSTSNYAWARYEDPGYPGCSNACGGVNDSAWKGGINGQTLYGGVNLHASQWVQMYDIVYPYFGANRPAAQIVVDQWWW